MSPRPREKPLSILGMIVGTPAKLLVPLMGGSPGMEGSQDCGKPCFLYGSFFPVLPKRRLFNKILLLTIAFWVAV